MELTRQTMWITVTVKSEALEAACGLQGSNLTYGFYERMNASI